MWLKGKACVLLNKDCVDLAPFNPDMFAIGKHELLCAQVVQIQIACGSGNGVNSIISLTNTENRTLETVQINYNVQDELQTMMGVAYIDVLVIEVPNSLMQRRVEVRNMCMPSPCCIDTVMATP